VRQRTIGHGRYELQPLARGGMGDVWVGHDTRLDREVAVKFVRFTDGVPENEIVRRFVRESRITARIRHPGVPAIFDVGTDDGKPYLVMERVHGISVSDLLAQEGRLSIDWAATIAAQTCAVLTAAHRESLVHRDLKPSNLMLEPDGTVKVLDFGLAVALDLAGMSRITRTGQNVGTPAYMAPEQVLAAMSEPRTDLYALGCTVYEMLTGQPVFTGQTSYTVMNKQVGERPEPVRSLRPEVPPELDALVGELVEKKPEDRPGSAQEVYERLLPFAVEVGPIPGVLTPPNVRSPVRMYATVVGHAFAGSVGVPETPTEDAADSRRTEQDERPGPGESGPTPFRGPITRDELEEARADAGELATQTRYREAAEVLAAVAESAAETFGEADDEVLTVRLELANVLFEGGDYHAAAPAYEKLVAYLVERDGRDSELAFRCRAQYAECQARLGKTEDAVTVAIDLLEDLDRVYGGADPRTLDLRRQIGLWQLAAGRHGEAGSTLRRLLDDLVLHHGERHPTVPYVRDLLAGLREN
jgi:hypothetical protein